MPGWRDWPPESGTPAPVSGEKLSFKRDVKGDNGIFLNYLHDEEREKKRFKRDAEEHKDTDVNAGNLNNNNIRLARIIDTIYTNKNDKPFTFCCGGNVLGELDLKERQQILQNERSKFKEDFRNIFINSVPQQLKLRLKLYGSEAFPEWKQEWKNKERKWRNREWNWEPKWSSLTASQKKEEEHKMEGGGPWTEMNVREHEDYRGVSISQLKEHLQDLGYMYDDSDHVDIDKKEKLYHDLACAKNKQSNTDRELCFFFQDIPFCSKCHLPGHQSAADDQGSISCPIVPELLFQLYPKNSYGFNYSNSNSNNVGNYSCTICAKTSHHRIICPDMTGEQYTEILIFHKKIQSLKTELSKFKVPYIKEFATVVVEGKESFEGLDELLPVIAEDIFNHFKGLLNKFGLRKLLAGTEEYYLAVEQNVNLYGSSSSSTSSSSSSGCSSRRSSSSRSFPENEESKTNNNSEEGFTSDGFVNPGLRIHEYGPVSLPITERDLSGVRNERNLASYFEQAPYGKQEATVYDKEFRDTLQMSPEKFEITNPRFQTSLRNLVQKRIRKELGLDQMKIEAKPYKLLLYKEGTNLDKLKMV